MLNPGIPFDISLLQETPLSVEDINERINRLRPADPTKDQLLQLVSLLDLTSLNATDTSTTIEGLLQKALHPIPHSDVQVAGVCVYQPFISQAVDLLSGKNIKIATVSGGFPSGQMDTQVKCFDIEQSVKMGAQEIDAVINRTYPLTGQWQKLYDEVVAMKKSSGNCHLKIILGTGELVQAGVIATTSLVCMMGGADFIKTSTGFDKVNATLEAGYMMSLAIRKYAQKTGYQVGLKPAGGIRNTKQAMTWIQLVKEELGEAWLNPEHFRIGASALLDDLKMHLLAM